MRLGRTREALSRGIHDFACSGSPAYTKARERDPKRLARAAPEFGKLKRKPYHNERTAIARTLKLVEERGLAGRIDLPQLASARQAPAPNGTSPPWFAWSSS
jgi:hypothetical protein